jgi:homoserine acetyltransferase
MMDALMPLASLPVQIGGRNRVWRDMVLDDLRNDPGYAGGEYTQEPHGLTAAVDVLWSSAARRSSIRRRFQRAIRLMRISRTRSSRGSRTTTRTT